MEDFKSQIKYVKGFMNPEEAKLVTDYAKNHQELFSNYGNHEQEFTVHTYHEIKELDPAILDVIQNVAFRVYDFVLNNYNSKFENFINEKTHIAKFVEGRGMHEHFDASRPQDIATLVYLNNEYQGGDIYFPKYEMSFKPERPCGSTAEWAARLQERRSRRLDPTSCCASFVTTNQTP